VVRRAVPLSEREREVLALLAGSLSLAQIAEELFVSQQHRQDALQVDLPQARGPRAIGGGAARPRALVP